MKIRKTKIRTKINMLFSLLLCVTILFGNTVTVNAETYHSGRFYFDISSVDSVEPGGDEVDFFNSEEKYYFYMFKALDYEWVSNKNYPSTGYLSEYAVNFIFTPGSLYYWKSSAEPMTYFFVATDKPLYADNECDFATPDMISLGLKITSQKIRAFVYYSADAVNWTRIYNGHEYEGTANGISKTEIAPSFMCFSSSRTLVMTTEPIRHYQTGEILYQKNMPDEWITNKTNAGQDLGGSGTGTDEKDPYDDYDVSDNLNFFQFVKARINTIVRYLGPAGTMILNLDKIVDILTRLPLAIYDELKDIPAFGYLEKIWLNIVELPVHIAEAISKNALFVSMAEGMENVEKLREAVLSKLPGFIVKEISENSLFTNISDNMHYLEKMWNILFGLPFAIGEEISQLSFVEKMLDYLKTVADFRLTLLESLINSDFGRWIFGIWDKIITLPADIVNAVIAGDLTPISVAEKFKEKFPVLYDPFSVFMGVVPAHVTKWFLGFFGDIFTDLFVPEKDTLFSTVSTVMDDCPLIVNALEMKGVFSDFFKTITGTVSPEIHLALSKTFLGAYGVEDYNMTFEWFEPYRDSVLLIESAFLYLMFGFHSYFDIKNMFNASGSAMNTVPDLIYQIGRFK